MLLNQDQDILADLSIAICSSFCFMYFCVFLYLVSSCVSLLVFYVFSRLSCPQQVSLHFISSVFSCGFEFFFFAIFNIVMCFRVFSLIFYLNVTARVLCVFVFFGFILVDSPRYFHLLCVLCVFVFFPLFGEICPSRGGWGEGINGSFPHQIR